MGCDIHAFIEKKQGRGWTCVGETFETTWSYGLFAFLTGGEVRNYSGIESPFAPKGLPEDISDVMKNEVEEWGLDAHTKSYLTLKELEEFDYSAEMEDRRHTVQTGKNSWDGGATCEPGEGKKMKWSEFLHGMVEGLIAEMTHFGSGEDVRVVFFFDN